eukprot:sb/3475035/
MVISDEDHRCDGVCYCPYCDDEMECPDWQGIRGTSINCSHPVSGGNRIVPVNWICDGIRDCLNGEDEEECTSEDIIGYCNDTIILTASKMCAPQNDNSERYARLTTFSITIHVGIAPIQIHHIWERVKHQ